MLGTALLVAGCANDIDNTQGGTEGMTEFAQTLPEGTTRTAGTYSGSGLDFYWSKDDQLWINKSSTPLPDLVKNAKNDIDDKAKTGVKVTSASFFFKSDFPRPNYKVRYTGNGNTVGDKVTIKNVQTQTTPKDTSHIGTDGDYGTTYGNSTGKRKIQVYARTQGCLRSCLTTLHTRTRMNALCQLP